MLGSDYTVSLCFETSGLVSWRLSGGELVTHPMIAQGNKVKHCDTLTSEPLHCYLQVLYLVRCNDSSRSHKYL